MLFQYTNLWQVFLHPRRLQLFLAGRKVAQIDLTEAAEWTSSMQAILSRIPHRLPFCDRIEFILDASQLHYLIVPWQEGVTTPQQRDRFATALYQQQGLSSGTLRIAFADSAYGKSGFAALMEDDVFKVLSSLALRHRLRFTGCCSLFDILWRSFGIDSSSRGLFACIGEVESSFAVRDENGWHSVFTLQLPTRDITAQLDIANRLVGSPAIDRYVVQDSSGEGFPHCFRVNAPLGEKV